VDITYYGTKVTTENIPRPAATVLVLRDGLQGPEIFMVRRHEGAAAFRGAYVFPGGRVDEHDIADASWCDGIEHAERQLCDLPPADAVSFFVGATRELFEEAGVMLARDRSGDFVSLAGDAAHERFKKYRRDVHAHHLALDEIARREELRLAVDALTLYGHWVTPPVEGRRYDTRFFVTRLPPFQTPAHDETETTESRWIMAHDALAAGARRGITLPPPTWITLRELEPFQSVDEIIGWSRTRPIQRREPEFVHENGAPTLVMPDQTRFVWTDGYWRPERIN
jgi:8-oxo-dGTP pyrophosphatase MutT (NUDIX family)